MTDLIPAWVNGQMTEVDKLEVHRQGLRHPAISVFVMDGDRTLLQRRALGKYHTPGLWANACCTHPSLDENPMDAAVRRLREELGIADATLTALPSIEYRAPVGAGLIEHEVVSLFLLHGRPALALNPAEVMETRWVPFRTLEREIEEAPESFTPWLKIYMRDHSDTILGHAA